MLDWQIILSFHSDRVQSQAFAQPPMFSFSLAKYMHDYTGITPTPGRGRPPPPKAGHVRPRYPPLFIQPNSTAFRLAYRKALHEAARSLLWTTGTTCNFGSGIRQGPDYLPPMGVPPGQPGR